MFLKTVFKKEDKDRSGTFDSYELRETLRTIGNLLCLIEIIVHFIRFFVADKLLSKL